MTRKIFWEDPYQRTLDTTVESVSGNEVTFKETIAYSESGGQESDRATVNGIEILSSRLDPLNHHIYYTLPEGHNLKAHDSVRMEIDWKRRFRLMRLHFSCELVLVLMNRHFAKKDAGTELLPEEIDNVGIMKMGAHMSEQKARVDFRLDENIGTFISIIHPLFHNIIDSDIPIETGYLSKEEERCYWKVKGLATVPCGGTHVRSTGEIGYVNLKRKRANKGVERIYITLVDEG